MEYDVLKKVNKKVFLYIFIASYLCLLWKIYVFLYRFTEQGIVIRVPFCESRCSPRTQHSASYRSNPVKNVFSPKRSLGVCRCIVSSRNRETPKVVRWQNYRQLNLMCPWSASTLWFIKKDKALISLNHDNTINILLINC